VVASLFGFGAVALWPLALSAVNYLLMDRGYVGVGSRGLAFCSGTLPDK
jgi:hypothetical protein